MRPISPQPISAESGDYLHLLNGFPKSLNLTAEILDLDIPPRLGYCYAVGGLCSP